MVDLMVRDLTKAPNESGHLDFITLTNPQWETIRANISLIKSHEKCELMYAEDFSKSVEKARADAIEEFLNTIKKDFEFKVYVNGGDSCDYTQQIISNMEFIAEQLKENKNDREHRSI